MAQNQFINVNLDPNGIADHRHKSTAGSAASGDVTVSFDAATVTSLSLLRAAVNTAMLTAAGQLPK
jgi:hypothetical protein